MSALRALASRCASHLAATTSKTTSNGALRALFSSSSVDGASSSAGEPPVDRYGKSRGPMAGLLRILRDDGDMSGKELYERAVACGVPTRSMTHMKSLLQKMKSIERVKTKPPVSEDGKSGKGRRRGNYTYEITDRGIRHVDELDRSVPA